MRNITYIEAIREATIQAMEDDQSVILIGEGVPDPKGVFGSTIGIKDQFPNRVFDMPVSENGLTGVCIGAATQGIKPIMVHMRIDFMMYAMDQIINNAAKWHSMFGGNAGNVPLVLRAIVGRGWGQGNQHSQHLAHLFATIPGLKVVCPATAHDAKEMMLWAVNEPNPVIFIEHRWLHNTTSNVPERIDPPKEIKPKVVNQGRNLTLVAWSYMVIEALKAADVVRDFLDLQIEVIDMRSLSPMDIGPVKESVKKTKRLVVLEEAWRFNSLSGEIITQVLTDKDIHLIDRPARITLPDSYSPSSPHLTKYFYPRTYDIVKTICEVIYPGPNSKVNKLLEIIANNESAKPHDVPDQNFRGPF